MTTIRISRLPEIKNDRVSADDFVILNDGDLVTSKISFGEFCIGIGAQDIEYSGDQLFTGSVVFEGSVTGDFYNKDQTYSKTEINQLISNLEDYNVIQDARVSALVTLSGQPELSNDLGTFPILATCVSVGYGGIGFAADLDNLTMKEAFAELRLYTKENRCYITELQDQFLLLRADVDELQQKVEELITIIEGINGPNPPNPDPELPPPDGILPWLNWLTLKVTEHEKTLQDHEERIEILEEYKEDLELNIIPDLTDRLLINDNENAALIKLSGMPQYAENLGNFAAVPVTHPLYNSTFEAPYQLTNNTIKQAFQNVYHEMRTRAGYTNPIFVEKITGPSHRPSVIPFYHDSPTVLNNASGDDYKTINEGTTTVEGAFAYTPVDNRGGEANEPKAWVRATNDWLQILTSGNFSALIQTLNLQIAKNDTEASALPTPVPNGFVYVQFDPAKPDEPPLLKTLGVNTSANPRPNVGPNP